MAADTDSLTGLLEVLRGIVTLSGLIFAATFSIAVGMLAELAEAAGTESKFSESGTTKVLGEYLTLLALPAGRNCSGWKNGLVS